MRSPDVANTLLGHSVVSTFGKEHLQCVSSYSNITLDETTWGVFDKASHDASVAGHERRVTIIDDTVKQLVFQNLRYMAKGKGRCLFGPIPILGLHAMDRLEPCALLRDVAKFEHQTCPFDVLFWRGDKDDRIYHNSPLMNIPGASTDLYGIDLLHTWGLGVMQNFVGFVLWYCIRSKIGYTQLPWLSKDEENKIGVLHLKSELWAFYAERRKHDKRWSAKGSQVLRTHTDRQTRHDTTRHDTTRHRRKHTGRHTV
jgi:hypothetical protein